MVEKNINAPVVDCCIGIPLYFTDLQRRSVMDAATIAGLKPLCLFHETKASALEFGVYKKDLPESKHSQLNVAFVDIGHATFKKGVMKILVHSFDQCLGVLFRHFSVKFQDDYQINVFQNTRACHQLQTACEKLKKVLSNKSEASVNIQCLIGDKDVSGFIKEEFEQICVPILERLMRPLKKDLAEDGEFTVEDVDMVEVVLSCSCYNQDVETFFGATRALNASENIARLCALQCAIFCPIFKVQKYQVYDFLPFSVTISWIHYSCNPQSTFLLPKGNPIPSLKPLAYNGADTFSVDVQTLQYDDLGEVQAAPAKSTYSIGPLKSTSGERVKMKVKVRMNLNDIVSIESATVLEKKEVHGVLEVTEVRVPVAELVYGGMTEAEVHKARTKEFEMGFTRSINGDLSIMAF
ncbi:putative Heat shock protein 70 family [Rosa chinensis]|uniref:Putative Heat shock protein 70 family n=1 Tax=Rosa chinensis TaxID=74649 RepID=A0A2P6PA12_ROSCH|nr:putative Heat shock protein 70 family [Rosa chinensis]